MSKSGGAFQIDDVTRTMCKGGVLVNVQESGGVTLTMSKGWGGAPGVPPIQVQTPPPPTWLAGYGPGLF